MTEGAGDAPGGPSERPTRRALLERTFFICAGGAAALVAAPGLAYLSTPLLEKGEAEWVPLGDPEALRRAAPSAIRFRYTERGYRPAPRSGVAWAVAVGGELRLLSPVCTHKGCNVDLDADRSRFVCPCHGGRYDLGGAVVEGPPPRPLERFTTKVEKGTLFIAVGPGGAPA